MPPEYDDKFSVGAGGQIITSPTPEGETPSDPPDDARERYQPGADPAGGDTSRSAEPPDSGADPLEGVENWQQSGLTREDAQRYAEAGLLEDYIARTQYLAPSYQQGQTTGQQPGQQAPPQSGRQGQPQGEVPNQQEADDSLLPALDLQLPDEVAPELAEPIRQLGSYADRMRQTVTQLAQQNQYMAGIMYEQMRQARVGATADRLKELGPDYEDVIKGDKVHQVAEQIDNLRMELEQGAAQMGRQRSPDETFEMAKSIVLGKHQANIARTAAARKAKAAKARHTSVPTSRQGPSAADGPAQDEGVNKALQRAKQALGE